MGLIDNKLKEIDEKCLRVILSCETPNQLEGALKYIYLVDKSLRRYANTPKDNAMLTTFIENRKGFAIGVLWQMQGRDYVINS